MMCGEEGWEARGDMRGAPMLLAIARKDNKCGAQLLHLLASVANQLKELLPLSVETTEGEDEKS